VRVVLRDVNLSAEHADPGAFSELARELQAGFVVELRSGEVTRISMAHPSLFAGSLARSIAAELALGANPSASAKRWEGSGNDAAGKYVTEYQTGDSADVVHLRKLRYAPYAVGKLPGSDQELTLTPRVVASQGEARIASGELQHFTYSERLTTPLLSSGTASAETRISLELLNRRTLSQAAPSYSQARAGMVDVSQPTPVTSEADTEALERSKIGDFNFASASQRLLELSRDAPLILDGHATAKESASDKAKREQRLSEFNRVFTALTAILRTDSAAVEACVRSIHDAERASFSVDALAGAGTAATQTALLALADDPTLPSQIKQRVESSLLLVETPTAATVNALLAWLDQPARRINAIYGLGIEARQLRAEGQLELAQRASRPLGQLLRKASGPTERVHLLRGIANSGDTTLLPAVKAVLRDPEPVVRGAALEALRLMDAPEVDGIIAQSLRSEQSFQPLRAAVDAAAVRAPSTTLSDALSDAARSSEDSQTRYRATKLLTRWAPDHPELRGVLSQIAEHEQNEDIRDLAAKSVAPS
jgi:hypothetical protein